METDYLTQILDRLNQWLSDRYAPFTERNVLFVRDDAVKYEAEKRCVLGEQIVPPERFSEAFASLLAGGPSWIHANVIPFGEDRFLITVVAGQKIGNPRPSINASYEPDAQAEIILTKALATAS